MDHFDQFVVLDVLDGDPLDELLLTGAPCDVLRLNILLRIFVFGPFSAHLYGLVEGLEAGEKCLTDGHVETEHVEPNAELPVAYDHVDGPRVRNAEELKNTKRSLHIAYTVKG